MWAADSLWSHPGVWISLPLLLGFLLLNVLAYRHARAMTRFAPSGSRTARPEGLSLLGKVKAVLWGVLVPRPANETTPALHALSYETLTFAGGRHTLEAWYLPHTSDRGLVLLFHGYTRSKADVLPEARAFHDLGYSCLLVDFPGSGGSGGESTSIGFHEAEDVACTVDFARGRWPNRRLILFGQSMGAAAVLRAFVVRKLAVDAAVLECPFDRLLTTVKARFAVMGLPATPGAHLLMFWGGVLNSFNAFAHNPVDYAAAATCPVLLLHGSNDARVTSAHIQAIFRRIAGSKRLYVFDGLGHYSFVNDRAEVWKEEVGRFLADEASASSSMRKTA